MKRKAAILIYVLVFGIFFLLLLAGLLGFILSQLKVAKQKIAWQKSFEIAEAGIDYYRWCLNNEINCPLEKDYEDIEGQTIGHFKIDLQTNANCGQIISQKIVSQGWTKDFPNLKRKISVFYAKESVAKYSYILNSNVWVGSDHVIRGPFHSNGGIRFDGQNLSKVSSAQEEWVCTQSFGCGPEGVGYGLGLCPPECEIRDFQCICPGVFSTTDVSNRDLFSFPIPSFDFDGITADLAQIKAAAQESGIYLPPSKDIDSKGKGYHLIFRSDKTVEIKIITKLSPTLAYSLEEGWHEDYFTIVSEYTYKTLQIPSDCSAIFVEDNLWPQGIIEGKVTVASANLIAANKDTDVILEWNLDYAEGGEEDGLTLIAERSILIGPDSPNDMVLRGIFIAQKGRFSRNHYPWNIKNSLTIYGSIVSNGRVGTQWITLGGHIVSGYKNRETYVDPNLIYNPPVFTPFLSQNFEILKWEEL